MDALTDAFDRLKVSDFARLRRTANLQQPTGGVFATGVRAIAQPSPATHQIPYGVTFAGGYRTYAVRPSRLDVSNRPRERWWGVTDQYPPMSFEWRGFSVPHRTPHPENTPRHIFDLDSCLPSSLLFSRVSWFFWQLKAPMRTYDRVTPCCSSLSVSPPPAV